jgi:hypothetical protein
MAMSSDTKGPKVFISFADPDKADAERLVVELEIYGINAFFAPRDTLPGENFVARLSNTIADSDYFVLLVSAASVDRPWVELEWTTALARELNERRAFLFLVRLDDSLPPSLLSTRHYLDAFIEWDVAVTQLVKAWQRDWSLRKRDIFVLPAPGLTKTSISDTIGIYIFNEAFSVQHFIRVASSLTGRQLYTQVRSDLALKTQVEAFEGQLGMRFKYLLLHNEKSIKPKDSLDQMGIKDETCLDMQVTIEHFGPDQDIQTVTYRNNESLPQIPKNLAHRLIHEAFGHLIL